MVADFFNNMLKTLPEKLFIFELKGEEADIEGVLESELMEIGALNIRE